MSARKTKKTFRPYDPHQSLLLPPNLRDWLDEDHPALFVADVVDELDLSEIEASYREELRGQPPFHPRMMVKILLWGYCVGVRSSRKIAARLKDDVAFRYLSANNYPGFRTISEFRCRHLDHLEGLFAQILELCARSGLVKLGHVALDGSKFKANASKRKAMSYGRMKQEEKRLKEEVRQMLEEAERVDREEDALFGSDRRGDELPEELRRRESRLEVIREARKRIEARARERNREKIEQDDQRKAEGKPPSRRKHKPGTPKESDQENFTDPESRIMKSGGDYVQGYNAQAAVDAEEQVIVALDLTNNASDAKMAVPLVEQIEERTGCLPEIVSADAGYFSENTITTLDALDVDPHVSTARARHGKKQSRARSGPLQNGATTKERMTRKLQTKRGRKIYARRKAIVEPVFGQIKQARGIRDFLLRGLDKVKAEWTLVCATHNLLKLVGRMRADAAG